MHIHVISKDMSQIRSKIWDQEHLQETLPLCQK